MKKVLHIIPSLELGGTEAFIMNHYRTINRSEIQFDFLVFSEQNWPYLPEIREMGGHVYYACQPSLKNVFLFYRYLKNVIRIGGPYIAVHCHADAGNAVPLLCSFLCGIQIRISHSHSSMQFTGNRWRGVIFGLRKKIIRLTATNFMACSEAAGCSLYGRMFFQKYGVVIKNGIFLEKFCCVNSKKVEELKSVFNLSEKNSLIVGNISRFDTNKNQMFIIEVFRKILRNYPNAVLLLGGIDGGKLQAVQESVISHGLQENVRFIGKRNDVAECLKLIDVYLIPSMHEGLPIGLLEAQASGCLCVASTGVPNESNMGLGNVFYLSLSNSANYWAEFICDKIKGRVIPTEEEIYNAFKVKAFDVLESTKELVKYYE
ncbi:MAG: glycosyltransferase [Peptococcaceae bacterium]|nr:glycosyltransferase [Peptococcaceae bacterium]